MSKWQQIQAERQALFWELVRQGTVLIHHRPSPLRSMPSHYRRRPAAKRNATYRLLLRPGES